MAFYARPTALISPGDIFPEIPVSVCTPPLKVARKSQFKPKAKFGPQDLRRIFTLPHEEAGLGSSNLRTKIGEETLVTTRVGPAMFLSWGSQVEADERDVARSGDTRRKGWLAAPIFELADIPEEAQIEDPDTHEKISVREVVKTNSSHNYFYLPPFPGAVGGAGQYVDFRKICAVGMGFFVSTRSKRLATLAEDGLTLLFSRLMWFLTRAEYFFQPVRCISCGQSVQIDVRFEGQNFEADPWE